MQIPFVTNIRSKILIFKTVGTVRLYSNMTENKRGPKEGELLESREQGLKQCYQELKLLGQNGTISVLLDNKKLCKILSFKRNAQFQQMVVLYIKQDTQITLQDMQTLRQKYYYNVG